MDNSNFARCFQLMTMEEIALTSCSAAYWEYWLLNRNTTFCDHYSPYTYFYKIIWNTSNMYIISGWLYFFCQNSIMHSLGMWSLQTSQASNPRMSSVRAMAMGDKAYRCNYEGCGRLYTTQHHLKVLIKCKIMFANYKLECDWEDYEMCRDYIILKLYILFPIKCC